MPATGRGAFIERAHRIADWLEFGIAAQHGEIRPRPVRPPGSMPFGS